MNKPVVKFVKLSVNAELPKYETPGAAGMDLKTLRAFDLEPGERKVVDTGLRVKIPEGFMGFVQPRSGLAAKDGITVLNTPGLIDCDYTGELKVILFNSTMDKVKHFDVGDRIAQLVIVPAFQAVVEEVNDLEETVRGQGGLGSTGVKSK